MLDRRGHCEVRLKGAETVEYASSWLYVTPAESAGALSPCKCPDLQLYVEKVGSPWVRGSSYALTGNNSGLDGRRACLQGVPTEVDVPWCQLGAPAQLERVHCTASGSHTYC